MARVEHMPLVAPPDIDEPAAGTPKAQHYWEATRLYYELFLHAMRVKRVIDPALPMGTTWEFSVDAEFASSNPGVLDVYLLTTGEVRFYSAGDTLPNGLTATTRTLALTPVTTYRNRWARHQPAESRRVKEIYYSDFEDASLTATLEAALLEHRNQRLWDHKIEQYGGNPATSVGPAEYLDAFEAGQEKVALRMGTVLGKMMPVPASAPGDPGRHKITLSFLTETTSDSLEEVLRFFIFRTRLANKRKGYRHLLGHPMSMLIQAVHRTDTTGMTEEAASDAVHSTAVALFTAARVDSLNHASDTVKENQNKYDDATLALDPDASPPTLRVQAQIPAGALAALPSWLPPGAEVDAYLNPSDGPLNVPPHGTAHFYLYNPDAANLHLMIAGGSTDVAIIPTQTADTQVDVQVTSQTEARVDLLLEVRLGSPSGPIARTFPIVVLPWRMELIRHLEVHNIVNDQIVLQGDASGLPQNLAKANYWLGRQANTFICPKGAFDSTLTHCGILTVDTLVPMESPLILQGPDANTLDILLALDSELNPAPPAYAPPIIYMWVWALESEMRPPGVNATLGTTIGPIPLPDPHVLVWQEVLAGELAPLTAHTMAHESVHAMTQVYRAADADEMKHFFHDHAEAKTGDQMLYKNLMRPSTEPDTAIGDIRLTTNQSVLLNDMLGEEQ